MRKIARSLAGLAVIFAISGTGCSSFQKTSFPDKTSINKRPTERIFVKGFYSSSIIYEVSSEAMMWMEKIENLKQYETSSDNGKTFRNLTEKEMHFLYVDADGNRDRYISQKEAEEFYKIYTENFERKKGSGEINFSGGYKIKP